MFGFKTAFSAAGKERSVVTLAHCPVRAASACSGSSPLPRRRSAGFENDSNGAVVERVGTGDCVSRRTVRPGKCAGSEHDSNGAVVERVGAGDRVSRRSVRPGKFAGGAEDDSNGALVECDVAGECVSRRAVLAGKALGSADRQAVGSPKSRDLVRQCHNSRIHGSQSSCFACARVSSGALLGACVVGSASAAVGSACLPAVRTRTYADVAASACGGMAVMQRHACNSVVSGGFLPVQKSTSHNVGTGRQGPMGTRRVKGWGFRSGRRFSSCLRGGGRGKFSASRLCTGAGCRFHSQEPTRHRYQACQGRCGHTFPPPGGSWYPIRVTWMRIGHQAIDGLDEGV